MLIIREKLKERIFRVFIIKEKKEKIFIIMKEKRKYFLLLCSPRHLYLVPTYSLVQWESQSNRSSGYGTTKGLLVGFSKRYSIAFKQYYAHMSKRWFASLQEWITKSRLEQDFGHHRI